MPQLEIAATLPRHNESGTSDHLWCPEHAVHQTYVLRIHYMGQGRKSGYPKDGGAEELCK